MLTRVFGRKKYGKTSFCMDVLKKCVSEQKKCYYIVPEQFTFSCEKKITDEIGNRANMYAEVLSFTRLCNRVFRSFGGVCGSYLDKVGKTLCMSRVLSSLSDELCEYSSSGADITFASAAIRCAEEFSSYNVTASDMQNAINELEDKNPSLCAKLKDMSLLASAYRKELKAVYGTDGESLEMLANVLEKNDFFGDSVVVIDSFYGFTPQELRIIKHIIRQSGEVYITFCTNKDDADPVFERPNDASYKVQKLSEEVGCGLYDICLEKPNIDSDITYLERNFTEKACLNMTNCDDKRTSENIKIISCRNPIDEAKAVASTIYTLISDKKTHFREIAVCARNIASYEGIIDVFLDKSDIPYTFSAKEDLLTKPIISYILTCIELISSWKMQSFICLLKTGLLKLSAEDAALLEGYVRTWNVNGKKSFNSEWFMNPSGYSAEFTEKDAEILSAVNDAKETVMDAVVKFAEDISDAVCCRDIASAVFRLMKDSSYSDTLSDEDDIRFWNHTVKALDEIVKVYGYDEMTPKFFADLFKAVINEYGIMDIPETCDSVLIGSADLIRSETVKYMFVLGCNNEYFPSQTEENGIFSDIEKIALSDVGINISKPSKECVYDEFFLAYNIFCDPYEKLFLLYSENDCDAKPLRRSVLLDTVQNLFDNDLNVSYPYSDKISNITTAYALIDDMYSAGDKAFVDAAKSVLSSDAEYSKVFENADTVLNESGMLSPENADALFGKKVRSSPSRFECYSSCRFNYFNRYILKLKPEKTAELDNIQTGLISHKILELFVKELADAKLAGEPFDHIRSEKRIKELLSEHFEKITHCKGHDSAVSKRFSYLYNRLCSVLTALAKHLTDDIAQSDFVPADFELNIGMGENCIESVPIELVDDSGKIAGELHIVGQVDRADVYKKDDITYVRIIDYKTGNKHFRKDDVAYGFNLQMLLYLYCISLSKTKKYGENIVPAGVLYVPVRRADVKDVILGDDVSAKYDATLESAFKGDGILIDDKEVLEAMDKGITGKFVPARLTKDGSFDKRRSKVESLEEMGALLKKAAEVSGKLASLMHGGNIQLNPYKQVASPCAWCDFAPLCRLDRKDPGIRYTMEEVQ